MKISISGKSLSLFIILIVLNSCVKTQSAIRLDLLGQVEIPYNYSFRDTPIGGLSGLTYDSDAESFFVISDDRSEFVPARFYRFHLQLNNQNKLEGIQGDGVTLLKSKEGNGYPEGAIDPEGIALRADSLIFISSEGDAGQDATDIKKVNSIGKLWPVYSTG